MKLHKLFIIATLLLLFPLQGSAYAFSVDNICYNILDADAKTVEVTYHNGRVNGGWGTTYFSHNAISAPTNGYVTYYYTGDIVVPSTVTYEGTEYIVTAIGDYAFDSCYKVNSITIPNTVKTLGKNSLCCYGVSMNTSSGPSATNLKSIVFESGSHLETIGDRVLYNCSKLISLSIPSKVTSIGESAFAGCSGLTSIYSSIGIPFTVASGVFSNVNKSTCTLYVPDGTLSTYKSTAAWNEFLNIEIDESTITSYDLIDATVYSNEISRSNKTITYTRNFKNTNWQALYIPFSLSYDDWKDKFEVARINNFFYKDTDDDGVNDESYLNVTKVKSGTLKPNCPYLIRAKATGEHTFTKTNATLYAAESNTLTCSSVDYNYTFVGTYQTVSDMKANGYYAMAGGALQQPSSESVTLSPYRWYLKEEAREESVINTKSRAIRIHIEGEEDETAIATLDYTNQPLQNVYNLNGQCVGTSLDALAPGIYIKNGKKYIVK